MDDRKKALFSAIIKEHICNCQAVGSKLLVDKYGFDVSPATVRNDLMDLEREGFLTHPYTSAGRIPTEKGWKYYLENLVQEKPLTTKEREFLTRAVEGISADDEQRVKKLAKSLAELSQEAVMIAFSPDDVYYTGISYLFAHPEFHEYDLISRMSEVVDHLDEVMHSMFPKVSRELSTYVGSDNPFGNSCSVMLVKYGSGEREGMVGILGPMRMDYGAHMGRLKYIQELLHS